MNNLIVGFSRARSPWKIGSSVIQKVDCREYSHCYIRYNCAVTKVELVAQASHGFVNLVSEAIFEQQNIIVKEYDVPCTALQYLEIMTFIATNLGKPYSKLQILLISIKKIFHVEVKHYDRGSAYICSEFAARLCSFANITVPLELDYINPSDLDKILQDAKTLERAV